MRTYGSPTYSTSYTHCNFEYFVQIRKLPNPAINLPRRTQNATTWVLPPHKEILNFTGRTVSRKTDMTTTRRMTDDRIMNACGTPG